VNGFVYARGRAWLAWFPLAATLSLSLPVSAAEILTIGLIPSEDPRVMIADNQAFLDALAQSLKVEIKPFVATDYNGVIEALRSKRLDIAFMGPFSYVLATTVADVEAFAVAETAKQTTSYRAYIIARKDRGIHGLPDLKGKNFAFVDPSSTSGHLFPKAALIKIGFDPDKDFAHMIFSGGHDASAIAVQNGKVDAAAIADGLFDAAVSRGVVKREDIDIIWTSAPIPGSPFVMRRDLPADFQKRVRDAFYAMRDIPWGSKGMLRRWEPVNDATYDVVRDAARILNLDLKKLK
jgi:phosphonate transport system substrate-binding protein